MARAGKSPRAADDHSLLAQDNDAATHPRPGGESIGGGTSCAVMTFEVDVSHGQSSSVAMAVGMSVLLLSGALAATTPVLVTAPAAQPAQPGSAQITELWTAPDDLATRDLFSGPWGVERAPDAHAVYTFVEPKRGGVNPGMTVRDPSGREWKVKQPPLTGRNAEGPTEVVLSRVLSALGYHQPPVYFLPSFTLARDGKTRLEVGGRFRLKLTTLKDTGEWSWLSNPFSGTRPLNGLLVILLIFNSSDLKSSNNSLYEFRGETGVERWYAVRDLGTALGSTARVTPIRSDPAVFARLGFIKQVKDGYVQFEYNGRHQELFANRITRDDVVWASALLGRLSHAQWLDAFRAGGYTAPVSERFIGKIGEKIAQGLALADLTER
jgi:hypothetical protein